MALPITQSIFAPGGLARNVFENKFSSNTPSPDEALGSALRNRVQEPLQKKNPEGVQEKFLQPSQEALLSQLTQALQQQSFTPEQAAQLIAATVTSPKQSAAAAGSQYKVQPGDTLSKIAQKFGVGVNQISGFRSGNPNLIFPGEVLNIGGSARKPTISLGSAASRGVQNIGPANYTGSLRPNTVSPLRGAGPLLPGQTRLGPQIVGGPLGQGPKLYQAPKGGLIPSANAGGEILGPAVHPENLLQRVLRALGGFLQGNY